MQFGNIKYTVQENLNVDDYFPNLALTLILYQATMRSLACGVTVPLPDVPTRGGLPEA
jgi:hypothetical protein